MQLYYGHVRHSEEESRQWFEASDREWAADIPIWSHKKHLEKPMLIGDDGPVPRMRAWYSQFYSGASGAEALERAEASAG
jgi:hypothetical protein